MEKYEDNLNGNKLNTIPENQIVLKESPLNESKSDIENQQPKINTTIKSVNQINEDENSIKLSRIFVFIMFLVILFVNGPFMICDIYFGLEDKSCVGQDVPRVSITLKTFLLVRGFLVLAFLGEILMSIGLLTQKTLPFCSCFQMSILMFVSLFLIAWNIVGAVIFWGYMDTDKCNDPVYNYTFASLIIFFISSGINVSVSSKKKE